MENIEGSLALSERAKRRLLFIVSWKLVSDASLPTFWSAQESRSDSHTKCGAETAVIRTTLYVIRTALNLRNMKQTTEIQLGDEEYPVLLAQIHGPPKKLYVWGTLPIARYWVAIVGSRKSTPYGTSVARQLAAELAGRGIVIVSGLAYGIDGSAHKGALEGKGMTVAVLGGGFNRLYPAIHAQLAKQVVENDGAVISEYAPGMSPMPWQFAVRNRIIAGLCQVTIVVEAVVKGASLITATVALDNNREVMAVPGNIDQPTSEGTNALLRQGAHVVTSAGDVLDLLGIEAEEQKASVYQPINPAEKALIRLISDGIHDGQELLERAQLDSAALAMTLTTLEINGVVRAGGANTWHLR
jgi:DNA processing protein